jgi:hypothetical protein
VDSIDQYLRWQDFGPKPKEPRYQLLTWVESTLVGLFQTVVIPTDKNANCLFIKVEQLTMSTDGLGGTIVLKDIRSNNNIFTVHNMLPIWSVGPLRYLVNDTKLTIQSNSATCLFSIGYSMITTDKIK